MNECVTTWRQAWEGYEAAVRDICGTDEDGEPRWSESTQERSAAARAAEHLADCTRDIFAVALEVGVDEAPLIALEKELRTVAMFVGINPAAIEDVKAADRAEIAVRQIELRLAHRDSAPTLEQRQASNGEKPREVLRKLLDAEERGRLCLTLANLGGDAARNATRVLLKADLIERQRKGAFALLSAGRAIAQEHRRRRHELAPKRPALRAAQ